MHCSLIVKFEVGHDWFLHIIKQGIEQVRESWPEKHVDFVEEVVKDRDLVLVHDLLVLLIDDSHQKHCQDVIEVICAVQ